jgi:hypothetical protein
MRIEPRYESFIKAKFWKVIPYNNDMHTYYFTWESIDHGMWVIMRPFHEWCRIL